MKFLFFRLLAFLPLPVSHAMGAALGWLFSVVPNRHRRIALININACFSELTGAQRSSLLRRSLIETGKTAMESPMLWMATKDKVTALVKQVSGQELLEQAFANGKGVIVVGPHLGSWELVSLYCSVFYSVTSLYRPLRKPAFEKIVRTSRERFGCTLVPSDSRGVRALFKALGNNEVVAIPPDQDPRDSGGAYALFFGLMANTMTLVPRLVQKSSAVPLLCYAERLAHGKGFHLHIKPLPAGFEDKEPEAAVAVINQAVEESIRSIPEQYQWCYKRFRTRPEGEKSFY